MAMDKTVTIPKWHFNRSAIDLFIFLDVIVFKFWSNINMKSLKLFHNFQTKSNGHSEKLF